MGITSKLVTPHAGIIIWNYVDRINASGGQQVHDIQEVIIGTSSLISISTSKRKSTPAGSFEFRLAPTYNWIARITPGSWCVLLMSQNKPVSPIGPNNPGRADPDLVKMLGRIHEVRVAVEVDQETGARHTVYVVTGQDWCSVFDTKLYIDAVSQNFLMDTTNPIGHMFRIGFDEFITEWSDKKHGGLPTTSQIIGAIIKIWGSPIADTSSALNDALGSASTSANPQQVSPTIMVSSESQFKLPIQVVQYMGLGDLIPNIVGPPPPSVSFADLIKRYDGVLTAPDTYSGDNKESFGMPQPDSFYKVNSFWQMLVDNSNPVINELVTDLRWDSNGASLALYKRVKPFINRIRFDGNDGGVNDGPEIKRNISPFSYVRTIQIPLEDVITINAGTNWRDKFNFIEMRPSQQLGALGQLNLGLLFKAGAQVVDRPAFAREGMKPLIQNVYYLPNNPDGLLNPLLAIQWKYLLQEWYFNTHLMLNGSLTIIGQNQHIQVGDNIQVDASVFGVPFNSLQYGKAAYLLAHVESIAHNFSVESNGGARSFATTVQFVRGVITQQSGQIFGGNTVYLPGSDSPLDAALDRTAGLLTVAQEKDVGVLTTSTNMDPNSTKLRGT